MARYRYDKHQKAVVEVRESRRGGRNDSGALWSDKGYDGLRTTDGVDISSRKKQRDYMKANGLTTVDDYKQTWKDAEKQRDHYRTKGGTVTKRDIHEAMQKLGY